MFCENVREELSQGDVFTGLAIEGVLGPSEWMVLSHDCEIDKLAPGSPAEHVLVCELRSLEDVPPGHRGNVTRYKVWHTFYVPGVPQSGERYLDFRRLRWIKKTDLLRASIDDRRIASLADDARRTVVYALASFLLHERLYDFEAEGVPQP